MLAKSILLSVSLLSLITGGRSQLFSSPVEPPPEDKGKSYSSLVEPHPEDKENSPVEPHPKDKGKSYSSPVEPHPEDKGKSTCFHLVIVPKVLKSGNTGQVFIDLSGCEENLQVKVTLEYNGIEIVIYDGQVPASQHLCNFISFQVPTVDKPQVAFVIFSAIGNKIERRERKTVMIDNMPEVCFVQMDKPIYKPGDKVRGRLICLNSDLKPIEPKVSDVCLQEPSGACIAYIPNPEPHHDVVTVEFPLVSGAGLGLYQFIFNREKGNPVIQWFTVERYELPKFESSVSCPSSISVLEETANIDVSAQYTYRKPVPGTVIARCCRKPEYSYGRAKNCFKGLEDICLDFTGQLDVNGAYSKSIDLDIFKLQLSGYASGISCDITMKENGTGFLITKPCYIGITSQPTTIQFDYYSLGEYYKHGLDFPFTVKLRDEKGNPMPDKIITIEVDGVYVKNVTTDADGKVDCKIDTSSYYNPNITIRASYKDHDQCYTTGWSGMDFPYAEYVVYRFSSQSNSYLQLKIPQIQLNCHQNHSIEAKYIVAETVHKHIALCYMVIARYAIVAHGQQEVDLTNERKGSVIINLEVRPEYAPFAYLLAFILVNGDIVADILHLDIEACFNNRVSLSVSETVVTPGSEIELQVSAAPGSLCGLRSIDAGLKILQSYEAFSDRMIYNMLQYYPNHEFDFEDPKPPCEDPNKEVYHDGRYFRPVSSSTDGDTHKYLKKLNLAAGTNLRMMKPVVCGMEEEQIVPLFLARSADAGSATQFRNSDTTDTFETFQSDFSDSFGFQTTVTDSEGHATVTATVPDFMAEWKSDMFCLSREAGFGMISQPVNITAALDFVVEANAPKFAVTGEQIVIDISASNFFRNVCLEALYVPNLSIGMFPLEDDSPELEICICGSQRAPRNATIELATIGILNYTLFGEIVRISNSCAGPSGTSQAIRRDTVSQTILVQPKGKESVATSSYLIPVNDASSEREINLATPENLVQNSSECTFIVAGETVGLAMDTLENQLPQPAGYAVQNLGAMRSVLSMVEYLNDTGHLTDELYAKAQNKLREGYALQMSYRSPDGRTSLLKSSASRNSWLDIDTFHVLGKMKNHIYVDGTVLEQICLELEKLQDLTTGCFSPVGSLYTITDKKKDDIHFTAYVYNKLLEGCTCSSAGSLINGAIRCLEAANFTEQSTYCQAYMFHCAVKAKQWDKCSSMFTTLQEKATKKDDMIYWKRENAHDSCTSEEVDMTENILMAIMKCPEKTQEQMDVADRIAMWLTSKINSGCAFLSSQDTATEALTSYSRLNYVEDVGFDVVLHKAGTEIARISVSDDNRFLVHRKMLPESFGTYKVSIEGTGNPLVQMSCKYNKKVVKEDSPFLLQVKTQGECLEGNHFDIEICASYNGHQDQTNLVRIDFKCLTGHSVDRDLLYQLVGKTCISEFEIKDNYVYFYLNYLTHEESCFSFKSFMNHRVSRIQNGYVTICDYCNGKSAVAEYSHPCSSRAE